MMRRWPERHLTWPRLVRPAGAADALCRAAVPATGRIMGSTPPQEETTVSTSLRFASSIASLLGAVLVASLLAAAPLQVAQAQQGGARNAAAAAPAADSGLQQRVEQLEEQLVDMQVTVGTLESLARGGAPAASSGGGSGFSSASEMRIDGLETQVRALAAQIEQLTQQMRALQANPRRTEAMPVGDVPQAPPTGNIDSGRFGSTTVTAGTGSDDAIGGLIENAASAPAASPAATEPPGSETLAAAPPAFMPPPVGADEAQNPKQLYETAYGYLMQRDYGAAQAAFEDFLKRYPNDSLAGNAQYWLGEAYFVRGAYKDAAGAFLKGYQNYAGNARAADSLLKLAMSLDRLGQTDAACSSFAELSTRFPNAPENVRSRAKAERQRIGCN